MTTVSYSIGTSITKSKEPKSSLKVDDISETYVQEINSIKSLLGDEDQLVIDKSASRLFVLDFKGGLTAVEVEQLRSEVTSVLGVAKKEDSILIRLESPGGTANGYGLGMAQLERIKARNIKLVVSVDRIAASGGYLMASVADEIIASPFAYVGSIGVVASMPNFKNLMDKVGIDFNEFTAGESKRNLGMFKVNTPDDIKKLELQLTRTHDAFKDVVSTNRPDVNISNVATGDYWLAINAKEKGLVDKIITSDDYILEHVKNGDRVIKFERSVEKPMSDILLDKLVKVVKINI